MNNIIPVQIKADFEIVADLAKEIWTEHYTPIIGWQQVEYMLEKFQSATEIENQIKEKSLWSSNCCLVGNDLWFFWKGRSTNLYSQ